MSFTLTGDKITFGDVVFAQPEIYILVDGREFMISVGYTNMYGLILEGGYCDAESTHVCGYTISMDQIRSPDRVFFGTIYNPSGV